MTLKGIHSVFFLGIGGIGMSALARWFQQEGYAVAGYDKTPSPLTDALESEGMQVTFVDEVGALPTQFAVPSAEVLVVWTPAIPKDSALLQFFQSGFLLKKRAEVLGMITKDKYTIAVAGTHGKTSTSSLIAHLLKSAGKPVTAFLGGITQNYNSNLILSGKSAEAVVVVGFIGMVLRLMEGQEHKVMVVVELILVAVEVGVRRAALCGGRTGKCVRAARASL
jgi:UDP-N-acetylmuramate--alanine ligase